jgi:hypothetical protein
MFGSSPVTTGYRDRQRARREDSTMADIWAYRVDIAVPTVDVTGFDVEATDGHIGKIDDASSEAGGAFLVVDTGFWIFGKKRVIPARAVKQVNAETETVYVDLTKDQIKGAPDFHDQWRESDDQREPYEGYYGNFPW